MEKFLTRENIISLRPDNLRIMRKRKATLKEMAKICGVSIKTIYLRVKNYKKGR